MWLTPVFHGAQLVLDELLQPQEKLPSNVIYDASHWAHCYLFNNGQARAELDVFAYLIILRFAPGRLVNITAGHDITISLLAVLGALRGRAYEDVMEGQDNRLVENAPLVMMLLLCGLARSHARCDIHRILRLPEKELAKSLKMCWRTRWGVRADRSSMWCVSTTVDHTILFG